jgi:hypothetical protein
MEDLSVPNRKVLVKQASTGTELTAETNSNGHYEIEVPPNS